MDPSTKAVTHRQDCQQHHTLKKHSWLDEKDDMDNNIIWGRWLDWIRWPGTSNTDPNRANTMSNHAQSKLIVSQQVHSSNVKVNTPTFGEPGTRTRMYSTSFLTKHKDIPGSATSVRMIGPVAIFPRTAARTTSDCTNAPSVPLANEAT